MHVHALGNIHDQFHVGVIVVISASGNFDVVVGHADVVGVGLQILGRGHDGELNSPLVTKRLVGPFPDGPDLLDCRNAIVGDENLRGGRLVSLYSNPALDSAPVSGASEHSPL